MVSYQDLVAQKAALEKQQAELDKKIAEALNAERASLLNQIRTLMAEHGITVADLSAKTGSKAARQPGAKSASAGRKVAPKYRDPSTGDTWSGRGLQPKWLKAALSTGRKLEDFAI